jgi:epoxyqueuosine reductase
LLQDFAVTVYFDNPNIWPEEEFIKRAQEAEKYFKSQSVEFVLVDQEHEDFKKLAKGLELEPEQGKRCKLCYHQRLKSAAEYAAKQGFEYFTTSLSISPYKNDKAIKNIGQALAKKYNIKYLMDDFRLNDGYKKATEFAKQQGFYRQKYCGCEFSLKSGKI